MKKVLFISPTIDEQLLVEEVAQHHQSGGGMLMRTTASFGQDASWWVQNPLELLIVKLPEDDTLQAAFTIKLRADVPKSLPVILLVPSISQSLLQLSSLFKKVRIVKTPVTGAFLYRSMVDIMTEWEPGKRQVHPRYATEQPVTISKVMTETRIKGVMRNLSVGGAYFETTDNSLDLQIDSILRIEINIDGGTRYEFDAKIVWSQLKDDGLTHGYGCTFIDGHDVYESLLKGFGGS